MGGKQYYQTHNILLATFSELEINIITAINIYKRAIFSYIQQNKNKIELKKYYIKK